jgi:23S rRNA U2552 (ribose-2'-O)-methylase RlmE/FtsJ
MSHYKIYSNKDNQQIIFDHFIPSFNPLQQTPHDDTHIDDTIIISKTLYKYLIKSKEEIGKYVNDWDKFKKYTNPYEFIHTTIPGTKHSVCPLKPLSRSFYKMIEICNLLHILNDLPNNKITNKIKSFHLAEGPGGFIEALVKLRNNPDDIYYGMTLINDTDDNVPGWKKSNLFLSKNPNVKIEKGQDGKGDITNVNNLRYCYTNYNGTMDIITADGGFDFSIDFNNQESSILKLILCQIAFAIAMQKKGGTFIIKFFDTFSKLSVDLLYLLSLLYEELHFVKPNTSRYANSEKYIVCKKFKLDDVSNIMAKLYTIINNLSNGYVLTSLFNCKLPIYFINKVEEYNAIFGQQQLENISTTINLILTNHLSNKNMASKLETIKKTNITKCVNWCQENNIPCLKSPLITNVFLAGKS